MESKKYNLEKAQEEAKKLKEKVKSGEALDYGDAEKKLEDEITIANEETKKSIIHHLNYGSIDSAIGIQDRFNLPDELIQSAVKEAIIHHLNYGSIDSVIKIKDRFNLPDEFIQSAEIQSAAKEGIISRLNSGNIDSVIEIRDRFNLPDEIIQSPELQSAVKEAIISQLNFGDIDYAIKIKDRLNLSDELIQSAEIQSAAKKAIIHHLNYGNIDSAIGIKDRFNLPDEFIQSAVKEEIISRLNYGNIDYVIEIKDRFNLPDEFIQSAAKEGIINLLNSGDIDYAVRIQNLFNISDEFIQSVVKEAIISRLNYGNIDSAIKIKNRFNLSDELIQSAAKEAIISRLNYGNIDFAIEIQDRFNLPDEFIQSDKIQHLVTAIKIFLNVDVEKIDIVKISLENLSENDFHNLFDYAKRNFSEWRNGQTISGPFQAGVEIFGYKKMLKYIRRKNLSVHDALHTFYDVLDLFRASGLSESEFYGQVLYQVQMDDREYPEGTAHHHLNAIAQTVNKNVAEVIAKVQEYKEIERLQELAKIFNTPQVAFSSWNNLKRYSELEQIIGQTGIFDELKKLKAEGNHALYRYIETLAFHPDSKVNMSAVIQFWRDPESFLDAGASHTPHEIHNRKKPSNYLDMPNLDLTALELRDALVEGKMDGLSVFTPLEIRYTIPLEDIEQSLPDLINKALGSNKKGIKGVARNSGKLFSELSKLFNPYKISVIEYIQGKSLPENIDISKEIEALLYDRSFGMERPLLKTREFVARISQKSDPEGAIAGDDTVNCMPFGDGKNTVYTFNPNTAQFVIRVIKDDGKERTIAQSVLTKDMNVKTVVPDIISRLQSEGGHLEDVLPEDILIAAPMYVACDNVEVSPNYSDERYQQIIEVIFRDFFREYISHYGEIGGLNSKKVIIGQGYTDALLQLPTEVNTFVPQAPVSYSDKTGPNVYVLDLESKGRSDLILHKQVREIEIKKPVELTLPRIRGLKYLTFEDALKVAYLEGKAYSSNQSLMQFLSNMENGLIAKDINNAAKDRPNLSLKYTDENGKMHGYILAWEGLLSDEDVKYDAGEFFGQPCIYIVDIATNQENRMAGGRLIQGFVELYKRNYLDKGNIVPIFAQMRESTSYQIVKKQLDKLGKDTGFNFELVELPTYEVEGDVMHPIIIRPVSIRT